MVIPTTPAFFGYAEGFHMKEAAIAFSDETIEVGSGSLAEQIRRHRMLGIKLPRADQSQS
jgi:hypothetical protein